MDSQNPFDFTSEDIRQAVAENRLLSLELEFDRRCNYRCPYCYATADLDCLATFNQNVVSEAIEQAAALGARKIVLLGGEPLLENRLGATIRKIAEHGMHTEIFTNGSLVNREFSQLAKEFDCRVVVKLNCLDAPTHDRLTGVRDSLAKSLRALELLQDAGLDGDHLCASTTISSVNCEDVVELWKYLRHRNIRPYFEIMTPQGRLLEHRELEVQPLKLQKIFEELRDFDATLGHVWEAQPPLVAAKCLRHKYSALVNAQGDVFPCVGIDFKLGNLLERPLRVILAESIVIQDLKNHREMIKGPCKSCENAEECYGCRGTAFQLTGDYLASDPLCWRNADKQDQIHVLPVDAAEYLPHKPPMVMVSQITEVREANVVSATIAPGNRFLGKNGVLDQEAIPELVAQAAAAMDSFHYDGTIRQGFLAIARDVQCLQDIRVNDQLAISMTWENPLPEWYLIHFSVTNQHNAICANGEINVRLQG